MSKLRTEFSSVKNKIMGHIWLSMLGGFLIWCFSGFKKKSFREHVYHKFAFVIGVGFIILIVIVISNI